MGQIVETVDGHLRLGEKARKHDADEILEEVSRQLSSEAGARTKVRIGLPAPHVQTMYSYNVGYCAVVPDPRAAHFFVCVVAFKAQQSVKRLGWCMF